TVEHNTFAFTASAISCTAAQDCGYNGLFVARGTATRYTGASNPYTGGILLKYITNYQNNHFLDNMYKGPWRFMVSEQGNTVSWTAWRSGSGPTYYGVTAPGQDAGSTLTPKG
ncbi:MAG: hypothetical protein ACRD6W_08785, partial [Nitrososphaerales archaeon]